MPNKDDNQGKPWVPPGSQDEPGEHPHDPYKADPNDLKQGDFSRATEQARPRAMTSGQGVYDTPGHENSLADGGGDGSGSEDGEPAGPAKTHRQRADELKAREAEAAKQEATKADKAEADSAKSDDEEPDDQVGKGFNPENTKKLRGKPKVFTRRRIIGFGIFGAAGGGLIALILFFLPAQRLDSYITRIQERAFAAAGQAVEHRLDNLFERYMIAHLLDMERCGAVVTNECRAPRNNQGMVGGLYNAWRDAKVEDRFLTEYGIQVESHRNPDPDMGDFRFTLKDRKGNVINLTEGHLREGQFTGGSREFGRDMRKFIKQETKWYQFMQRRSERRYLKQKHNVKLWCFFACKDRDSLELRLQKISQRFKFFFTKRFVYPFSEKLGIIMDCLTSGGGSRCTPEGLRNQLVDRVPDTEFTDRIRAKIDADPSQSFMKIILEELIEKLAIREGTRTALRSALSAIPIAGQIYMAVVIVDMLDRVDVFIENRGLSHFAADINARQYIEWISGMRSLVDEQKKGHSTLEEAGQAVKEFEGAEKSELYQLNYGAPGQQPHRDPDYRCPSGKPLPENEPMCPEKTLKRVFAIENIRNNDLVDGLADILNSYGRCILPEVAGRCPSGEPRDYIRPILNGIDWIGAETVGRVSGLLTSLLQRVPGVGGIYTWAQEKGTQLVQAFLTKIFPLPVQEDSQPREKYDGLEAGGVITAMEFNKGGKNEDNGEYYGLGAPQMTDEQALTVYAEYMDEKKEEYQDLSLIARLTDKTYSESFMNQLVDAVPSQKSEIPARIASAIPQMFSNLANMVLGIKPAHALDAGAGNLAVNKAVGSTIYGFPSGSPEFTTDPELMDEEYCERQEEAREASKTEGELSGFDEYTIPDGCQLTRVAAETGMIEFTHEEGAALGANPTGGGGGGAVGGGGGGPLGGDARTNAQAIIANPNITGNSVYIGQIERIAAGDTSCNVNPTILALINSIGTRHQIYITSLNRLCTGVLTASGSSSYHYRDGGGHAVDIGTVDGVRSTGNTANDRAVLNEIMSSLPSGSGIGQSNCRSPGAITLGPGIREFNDTCNHIHIQVPVQ